MDGFKSLAMWRQNTVINQEKNERWNIPEEENTSRKRTNTQKIYMRIWRKKIKYSNVELKIIDQEHVYVCKKCDKFRSADPVAIRGHLARKHKRPPIGRTICPYCPPTFWQMGNLKRYFRENNCKNVGLREREIIRNDVNNINNEFNANEII